MEKALQRKNENSFTVMHAAFLELLSIIVDDKRFQCAIQLNAISGHRSAISNAHNTITAGGAVNSVTETTAGSILVQSSKVVFIWAPSDARTATFALEKVN
jgi:hypothetical protein